MAATEEQTQHDSIMGLDGSNKTRGGQSFSNAPNRVITKLAFKLVKLGSPTGNVTFTIRRTTDGVILNSKVWGNASALPTTYPAVLWEEVTFDTPVLIDVVSMIFVEFSGGDAGNQVAVSVYTASDIKANEDLYDIPFGLHAGDDCTYIYTYLSDAPSVTTKATSAVTATTATGNGNIISIGDASVTQHGHCWALTANPTITDGKTEKGVGSVGAFTSAITGLIGATLYHTRAYATNAVGTSYGAEVTFTTLPIIEPTVSTDPATSVEETTATLNGTLDDDGREACVCGFEYGETTAYGNTTPPQSRTTGQTLSQAISGLTPGKHYHFRAIATNSAGTTYGSDRGFFAKGGKKGNPNVDQLMFQHVERME